MTRKSEQLRTLLKINEKNLTEQSLPGLIDHIARSAVDFFKVDAATLRLADEERKVLVLKSTCGIDEKSVQKDLPINEESAAGVSYLKGTPVNSSNIPQQSLHSRNQANSKELSSVLALPLKVKDRDLGVLSVYKRGNKELSSSEIELADMFASQASLALMRTMHVDQLRFAAITDSLTGLYNEGYFYKRLHEEINRAERSGSSLSLLFIDVDGLKRINDSHGHLVGDEVLTQIAKRTGACVRKVDILARYGGDELVTILPATNGTLALEVAERIRERVANTRFQGNISLTVSIGIASYPKDATSARVLLDKADKIMYQAKQKGMNRVEISGLG